MCRTAGKQARHAVGQPRGGGEAVVEGGKHSSTSTKMVLTRTTCRGAARTIARIPSTAACTRMRIASSVSFLFRANVCHLPTKIWTFCRLPWALPTLHSVSLTLPEPLIVKPMPPESSGAAEVSAWPAPAVPQAAAGAQNSPGGGKLRVHSDHVT